MNIREAYRRFHAEDMREAKWRRSLRRIEMDIESIRLWQDSQLVWMLTENEKYRKVVLRYTGHTAYGWRCACDGDGRIARLPDIFGWERFSSAVDRARDIIGI